MNLKIIHFFVFVFISSLTSYGQTKILYIKHGTSFGMCEGYCYKETTYSISKTVKHKRSWKKGNPTDEKDINDTIKTDEKFWVDLVKAVKLKTFQKLPNVIGCPDCTDGGQEWITIATKNKSHTVEIEYNADIDFDCLKAILLILRHKNGVKL